MTRLPPSATRTGTLLPDTTLFRSVHLDALKSTALEGVGQPAEDVADIRATFVRAGDRHQPVDRPTDRREIWVVVLQIVDRKSIRLNSSHLCASRMPASA